MRGESLPVGAEGHAAVDHLRETRAGVTEIRQQYYTRRLKRYLLHLSIYIINVQVSE